MNLQTIKNFFNLNKPEKKEDEERKKKLEELRDLWLNYSVHYFLYNIYHKHPMTNKPDLFKFHYMFSRKKQKEGKKDVYVLAMEKAQGFLNKNVAYWMGNQDTGIVINDPIFVNFEEITKKEYEKIDKKANAKKRR